jgi:Ca2+-binding RTX toxin-like protein
MPQIENLTLSFGAANGTGNGLANVITGNGDVNILSGLGGNDVLIGNAGADRLIGGADADVFRYLEVFDSSPTFSTTTTNSDVIEDFTPGVDKIDLQPIDRNFFDAVDDAFTFIGTNPFSGAAGEVRYEVRTIGATTYTAVQANANTDTNRDMEILLVGNHVLVATDFVL